MRRLPREEYAVGWVRALPVELAAALQMLDEEHEDLRGDNNDNDENLYSLESIAGHNVVIVCLPAGCIGLMCRNCFSACDEPLEFTTPAVAIACIWPPLASSRGRFEAAPRGRGRLDLRSLLSSSSVAFEPL